MTGILQAILSFFGVTPAAAANYIEDVFSTYLYTGTAAAQTITNNIDVSGKGGLVWIKSRTLAQTNMLYTQALGVEALCSSNTNGLGGFAASENLSSFNSNGFSLLSTASRANTNAEPYVSWTFREQAKFFDIVTYTGNSTARTISHNLGSVPGCIIVKATSAAGYQWQVYHRSLVAGNIVWLNLTDASTASSGVFTTTAPTSTVFSLGAGSGANDNGVTYIAYLFAHDAGGFGATGSDNVISCGSFTTDGSGNATVTLGYEPQWVLIKRSDAASNWFTIDNMRGFSQTQYAYLLPNTSGAESSSTTTTGVIPNATGFTVGSNFSAASATYIYVAIRRGPMKTPTSGTSVFAMDTQTSFAANELVDSNFPPDQFFAKERVSTGGWYAQSRLTGGYLSPSSTAAETSPGFWFFNGAGGKLYANTGYTNTPIYYLFARAPGFFDVVCYTGTTADNTQTHNLSAVPELIIIKRRDAAQSWAVFNSFTSTQLTRSFLNLDSAATTYLYTDNVGVKQQPTSTQFVLNGANTFVNVNAGTYVAYLFATVAGVSKVGSYTGTGALQTVNCGFTSGARFVLIKRTDSTGDWWVYDSARGITSGNDPYLFLNSTAAEVTTTNYVDTDSTGFKVTAAAPAGLNASGGSYLFLAIA